MVQKETKRRGRPRAYDPDVALAGAIEAFWKAGYSATSLDDLSAATGMNRPSLYAAFGGKEDIYLEALAHYGRHHAAAMREVLGADVPVRDALARFYGEALKLYVPPDGPPRGCFAVGTAPAEAVASAPIREALLRGLRALDRAFEARFGVAHARGELPAAADPAALAKIASATLHTLAVRARAGTPRAELDAIAAAAVDVICGPARTAA